MTPEQLQPVAARHLGPAARVVALERGPRGNGQETWFADIEVAGSTLALVIRRTAAGGTMAWTDRRREFETMVAAGAAGLPVPEVLWFEAAGGELERSHFAMRRVPGEPAGPGPDGGRAIAGELGRQLARLHALDPPPGAPGAADATAAELARWRARHVECGDFGPPIVDGLLAWLDANPPAVEGRARLLWGDPGPHNLLVEGGRVTAMLDWEMSHLGHPLDDLAVAMWSCLGLLPATALLAGYEAAAGPVDRRVLRWFRIHAAVARGIAIVQGVRDFVSGTVDSPVVAALGWELLSASLLTAAAGAGWRPVEGPALAETPPTGLRPTTAEAVEGVVRFLAELRPDGARERRMLKGAVALLRATAERERRAAALAAWRAGTGDLRQAAVAAEQPGADPGFRDRVRGALVGDLLAEREAFGPLRDLFGPSAAPPVIGTGNR